MKIKRTILPDQPGTKYWIEKYGKDLVCVRYRYDEKLNKKITTVEIIVDEKSWQRSPGKIPANKIMFISVMYGEVKVANLIKAAGGRWNRSIRLWELAYKDIINLGLEDRIVK